MLSHSMTNQTGRIAVIPARGGSKRIPRKNVKLFAGQPMISYAIRTALESRLFEHVVVSTDDDAIVEVARKHGAEVPFIRPKELSDDDTTTVPVIVHAISSCTELGMNFDTICCIYPCVPFLQVRDLVDSFQLFTSADAQFCFPVVEFPSPIQRALSMNTHGELAPFLPDNELSRTQDLTATYHDAGQFYWGSSAAWKTNTHIHSNAVGYVIPSWRTIDIDTPDDWARAEILAKSRDDLFI
jgi:pseudaminic acid cytidylyltransferase